MHNGIQFKKGETKMKYLILVLMLLTSACATQQPKGYELPPALSEVFRSGQLKGLENSGAPVLGTPTRLNRVGMVCVQEPEYDMYGYYMFTSVTCY